MDFPKKKWLEPEKSPTEKAVLSEDALQVWLDDELTSRRIRYFRIPNKVWGWLAKCAPPGMLGFFRKQFGGRPDNTCEYRVCDRYSLSLKIELKTEDCKGRAVGKLHGKQKSNARKEPWRVLRNKQGIVEVLDQYERDAEILTRLLAVMSFEDMERNLLLGGGKNVILREIEEGTI